MTIKKNKKNPSGFVTLEKWLSPKSVESIFNKVFCPETEREKEPYHVQFDFSVSAVGNT